jgi:branched-chain amino acid transport system ATP-binding protein
VLVVDRLTKRFGGFVAVGDVSFEVREGEILGLIGPNGSGKSTIFNLISGALKPSSGSIRFAGAEIGGRAPNLICHMGIARTHQIPRPFKRLSLIENVAVSAYYGQNQAISRDQAWSEAEEALALVNLPTDPRARPETLGAAATPSVAITRLLSSGSSTSWAC